MVRMQASGDGQGELPLEQQIVAAIRQIVRAVDLHSHRILEACGLTGPQLTTLSTIARIGPTTPTTISRTVHLSQGTVTGILQRLEKRELVRRTRGSADRRTVTIEITDAGRAVLERAPSLLQDRFRSELTSLAEWERLQILATLQRVAGLMGAERLDAAPHLVTGDVHPPAEAAETAGPGEAAGTGRGDEHGDRDRDSAADGDG